VIDEARFVTKKHGVQAKWEEFTVVCLLNLLFSLFFVGGLIHVEEIA
jgi:hypothetical protein